MSGSEILESPVVTAAVLGVIAGIGAWVKRKLSGADKLEAEQAAFVKGMFPTCFQAVEAWGRVNKGATSAVKLNHFHLLIARAWLARFDSPPPSWVTLQADAYAERHALTVKAIDPHFAAVLASIQNSVAASAAELGSKQLKLPTAAELAASEK
jgi:hypothetical protein